MNKETNPETPAAADQEIVTAVREALNPLTARMDAMQRELDAFREAGERPDAPKVLDVEEQLAEVRAELSEEVRKLRVAVDGTPHPDRNERGARDVFSGVFVRDANRVREGIREHGGIENAVNKRAFDTTDLATAGQLNAQQANAFIDSIIAEQDTLSRIRTMRMSSPTRLIEELTLGKRKIRKATEGAAPTNLANVGSRKRTLTTVETILPEDLTLSALEDNIERGGLEQHIARILSTQFGNDLNDLGWNGEASFTSTDSDLQGFLSINNGWFQIMGADANVSDYDATGDSTHTEVLNSTLKTMPNKYKRGGLTHYFFVPVEFAEGYLDELSSRATALGDTVLRSGLPAVPYFGIMLIADNAIDPSDAKLVLTPGDNLVFGIQRDLRVESEYQPRKRLVEYTLTARTDFEVVDPNAIVLTSNIPSGLLN